MSFQDFLLSIINCFNNIFKNLTNIIEIIMNNNFIKLIIYLTILYVVINYLFKIISTIFNITSKKVALAKNKQSSSTDIE